MHGKLEDASADYYEIHTLSPKERLALGGPPPASTVAAPELPIAATVPESVNLPSLEAVGGATAVQPPLLLAGGAAFGVVPGATAPPRVPGFHYRRLDLQSDLLNQISCKSSPAMRVMLLRYLKIFDE